MSTLRPGQVRTRLLRAHGELQDKLLRLATAADDAGACTIEDAVELSRRLFEQLADQLDVEEQLLVPLLREADAWGEVRIDRLARLHDRQWQELKVMRASADSGVSRCQLADALVHVVRALRSELLVEDRELLAPEVLRDDVLGIDVEDG